MSNREKSELIVYVAMFLIYLLPTIVATLRQRPNVTGIAFFNIIAGWTVIGWVLSLIWSFSTEGQAPKVEGRPQRVSSQSPVAYAPTSQREAAAALVDSPPASRARFADAEEEARAAHRRAQQPGGGGWS